VPPVAVCCGGAR